MPPSKAPKVARVEDYDEDKRKIKSGSKVEARCNPPPQSKSASASASTPAAAVANTAVPRPKTTATETTVKAKDTQTRTKESGGLAAKFKDVVTRGAGKDSSSANKSKDVSNSRKPTKEIASDSGYSSHASDPRGRRPAAAANVKQQSQQTGSSSSSKAKPTVKPIETRRPSSKAPPARASSSSRQPAAPCSDLSCRHAACFRLRYPGYAVTSPAAAVPSYASQYYQAANAAYGYPAVDASAYRQYTPAGAAAPQPQMSPTSPRGPQPRTRPLSYRARPQTIHVDTGYSACSHGPPPSMSAYHNLDYLAMAQPGYQHYYSDPQQQAYYGGGVEQVPMYPTTATLGTSPATANGGGLERTYSTRRSESRNDSYGQQQPSARTQLGPNSTTTVSARQPSQPTKGILRHSSNRNSTVLEPDFDSEEDYSSASSDSVDVEPPRRSRRERQTYYPSAAPAPLPTRRPSLRSRYVTDPLAENRRSYHEPVRRIRTVDDRAPAYHEYWDVSDPNMDSDRTERPAPVVERTMRPAFTNSSRSSRRASVTTTNSSGGRTRDTGMTSTSGSRGRELQGQQLPYRATSRPRQEKRSSYYSRDSYHAPEYFEREHEYYDDRDRDDDDDDIVDSRDRSIKYYYGDRQSYARADPPRQQQQPQRRLQEPQQQQKQLQRSSSTNNNQTQAPAPRRPPLTAQVRSLEDEHDLLNDVSAYQDRASGNAAAVPLTAENIRLRTGRLGQSGGAAAAGGNAPAPPAVPSPPSDPPYRAGPGDGADDRDTRTAAGAANPAQHSSRRRDDSFVGAGGTAASVLTTNTTTTRRNRGGEGGLQIVTKDMVWNIHGESTIDYTPARDGEPAQVFVGAAFAGGDRGGESVLVSPVLGPGKYGSRDNGTGGGGRDSAYYGSGSTRGARSSKGSVNSFGRSQVGAAAAAATGGGGSGIGGRSRRDTVLDEYEAAL